MNAPYALELRELLKQHGRLLENDHFVLKSGQHADTYVNLKNLHEVWPLLDAFAKRIAEAAEELGIELVAGVETGGTPLARRVAELLPVRDGESSPYILAIPKEGRARIPRDAYCGRSPRTLIVEDVVTSGGSLLSAVKRFQSSNRAAEVVAAATAVNRKDVQPGSVGVDRLITALHLQIPSWNEDEAPVEIMARPVNTDLGHGKAYLERKAREASA